MPAPTTIKNRTGRRVALVAVAAMIVGVVTALSSAAPPATEPASGRVVVEFGCEGTMVIANVECARGVATAFDGPQQSDGRAPWCGPEPDLTIYGCPLAEDNFVWACASSAPSYDPAPQAQAWTSDEETPLCLPSSRATGIEP